MAETENRSNSKGFIIEISGKALIHNLYLEHINQHQIEIGLPQLDNADRHIMLSQNGNANNQIDLSKYSSIDIIEISQQPTAARQREDINLEPALARNQERLSDFYQSYKNEDSSIDWSKVATKITLSNTSGKFYDHEDKYTTGLKIEFSTQGVESIEFRDDTTGETIATLSASELPATMVIGNLCQIDLQESGNVRDPLQHVLCAPVTTTKQTQYNDGANSWSLCKNCGVLYNNRFPTPTPPCFGSNTHSPYSVGTSSVAYNLPYNTTETRNTIGGSGNRCSNCQAIYYPNANGTACPSVKSGNIHTNTGTEGDYYWAITNPDLSTPSDAPSYFFMCITCGSLYATAQGIGNVCNKKNQHIAASGTFKYSIT